MADPSQARRGRLRRLWWQAWDSSGWAVLSAAVLVVLVTGFWGFTLADGDAEGRSWSAGTRLYLAVQLFTGQSGEVDGDVPVPLEIARWVAPLLSATAVVGAVRALLRHRTSGWRARRLSGHLVVVGLGERGWLVVSRAVDDGTRVAAVELDPANPNVARARRLGVPVLLGDATEQERLLAAGVARAARVICLAGDGRVGASVAQSIAALQAAGATDECLASFVEVPDVAAMRELQRLLEPELMARRQELFNLQDRVGAVVLDRFDPPQTAPDAQVTPLVVVGDGDTALSVLVSAAQRWEGTRAAFGRTDRLELRLLVPDTVPLGRFLDRAEALHPELAPCEPTDAAASVPRACRLTARSLSTWSPDLDAEVGGHATAPLVVVAVEDEALQLRCLARLTSASRGVGRPVVLVCRRRTGAVSLLQGRSDAVRVLVVDEELCSDDGISAGRLTQMARALHDGYRRMLVADGGAARHGANPAFAGWDELSAELKEQNLAAAQSLWDQLREEGYLVVPRGTAGVPVQELPDGLVERLAAREHRRWHVRKYPGRTPPAWPEVAPTVRHRGLDQARRTAGVLAVAGLQVVRAPEALAEADAGPVREAVA